MLLGKVLCLKCIKYMALQLTEHRHFRFIFDKRKLIHSELKFEKTVLSGRMRNI